MSSGIKSVHDPSVPSILLQDAPANIPTGSVGRVKASSPTDGAGSVGSISTPMSPSRAAEEAVSSASNSTQPSHPRTPPKQLPEGLGLSNLIIAPSPSLSPSSSGIIRQGSATSRSTEPSLVGLSTSYGSEWGYTDGRDPLSTPSESDGGRDWDSLATPRAGGGTGGSGMRSSRSASGRSNSGMSVATASPASISLSDVNPALIIMPEVPWNMTPSWARHCWQSACVKLQERVRDESEETQSPDLRRPRSVDSVTLQKWRDEAVRALLKELQMRLLLEVGAEQVEVFEEMFEADHMFVVSYLTGQNS